MKDTKVKKVHGARQPRPLNCVTAYEVFRPRGRIDGANSFRQRDILAVTLSSVDAKCLASVEGAKWRETHYVQGTLPDGTLAYYEVTGITPKALPSTPRMNPFRSPLLAIIHDRDVQDVGTALDSIKQFLLKDFQDTPELSVDTLHDLVHEYIWLHAAYLQIRLSGSTTERQLLDLMFVPIAVRSPLGRFDLILDAARVDEDLNRILPDSLKLQPVIPLNDHDKEAEAFDA